MKQIKGIQISVYDYIENETNEEDDFTVFYELS